MYVENNRNTRRGFLKGVGGVSATMAIPGFTAARAKQKQENSQSLEEAGLTKAFKAHLDKGNYSQAFKLLEKHNIPYRYQKEEKGDQSTGSDSGVSTQDYFNNPVDGQIYQFDASYSADQQMVGFIWDLYRKNNDLDGPAPRDIAVLAWDGSSLRYSTEEDVMYSVTFHYPGGTVGDEQGIASIKSRPLVGDGPANAYVIAIDDNTSPSVLGTFPYRNQGAMQCVLETESGHSGGNVVSQYTHTWSAFNNASYADILELVSVSPTGGISVSTPPLTDSWSDTDDMFVSP